MIHKNALIIIYDFAFAINDIYLFLENFPTNHEHAFDRKQYQNYINNIYMLTQFYFDSLWIQNVANLYGATLPKWKMIKDIDKSKKMDYEKIRTIYEIYGFFMTIKKSIDNPRDYYLCKNAFDTMNQIFNVSIDKNSKDSAKKNINLNQNINDIFISLGKAANLKEEELLNFPYEWLKLEKKSKNCIFHSA